MVSTCPKRERFYGPFVPRSSIDVFAPAPAPQSSTGSLLSDQLSQIASYLTQNLSITGASLTSDFTVVSAIFRDSLDICDSGVTHHMIFEHSFLHIVPCF